MCMAMGSSPAYQPTPPPAAPLSPFDTRFNAEMSAKAYSPTITRDNPLLNNSQRAQLDARNLKVTSKDSPTSHGESSGAGLQY